MLEGDWGVFDDERRVEFFCRKEDFILVVVFFKGFLVESELDSDDFERNFSLSLNVVVYSGVFVEERLFSYDLCG